MKYILNELVQRWIDRHTDRAKSNSVRFDAIASCGNVGESYVYLSYHTFVELVCMSLLLCLLLKMTIIIISYQEHFNLTQIQCICVFCVRSANRDLRKDRARKTRQKKASKVEIGRCIGIAAAKCHEKIDCSSKTMGEVSHVNESIRTECIQHT